VEGTVAQPASPERVAPSKDEAFDAFASRRIDHAYRLACLILMDAADAEDAAHDAFVKAARGWRGLKDASRVDAWFDRILVNVCRDRLRGRRRSPITEISDGLAASLATQDGSEEAVERDLLRRAMRRLRGDLRIVVVLRFFEDLSVEETARRLAIPTGTVKSRQHQALRDLTAALAADDRCESR
jgi:RNA polymerase sigma-70 factor (ECF subfamily)